ncbi:Tripartite tricarboxylate transporter TctB family protein [Lentibacillus halodurans]|uniref:Tripartite tricarboxylate transporter TctB family protein n=1 Tax=Lentibacillus halodurans TaxID=237679 RepID=A0A1I0XE45_9BACI|nr:tripartite tricarboxylate transporter TctB family protein [Lentibacillus halodurans]SFA99339.1 Tripartite tricarboxylate transporter TctB family protein [Lentibacillus halodurans]
MQKVNYNTISSVILIIVACLAIWETKGLSEMSYVFPRTIGLILLILSIAYYIKSMIKSSSSKLFEGINKRKVVIMSLSMIGYVILISLFGFLMASMLFIGWMTWYLQQHNTDKSNKAKIVHASISSISISIFFFVLFRYVFVVPLPSGLLFG